jgi:hypothetical protein
MEAARDWAAFVAANQERFQAAGLPLLATQSVDHWDELLMHGRFDHQGDASHFHIAGLPDDQYALLVDLVESYFLAGYEYFTPTALKPGDRARLTHRFGR